MRRPRRVAAVLAVPVAAVLVGSFFVDQNDDPPSAATQQQLTQVVAAALDGLAAPDGGTGAQEANVDLAAAQEVAFAANGQGLVNGQGKGTGSDGARQSGTSASASGSASASSTSASAPASSSSKEPGHGPGHGKPSESATTPARHHGPQATTPAWDGDADDQGTQARSGDHGTDAHGTDGHGTDAHHATVALKPNPALIGARPFKIRAAAVAAALAAHSVRIRGAFGVNGVHQNVDVKISLTQADGAISGATGTVRIRRIGTTVYFQADASFLKAHGLGKYAHALHGRWVTVTSKTTGYQQLATVTYLRTWATEVIGKASAIGTKKGITLGGLPTVTIYGGHGAHAQSLYVASAGPAFPLYQATHDKSAHLAYTDWNRPLTVQAPSAAELLTPVAAK